MSLSPNLSHECFPQPESTATNVWRYLSTAKLLDLLQTSELHLTRLDLLGDPYEGTIPRPLHTMRTESSKKLGAEGLIQHFANLTKQVRQSLFASCWNLSPDESEALWRLYAGTNEGVAIQTSYQSLADLVGADEHLFVGKVTYIDYELETFPHGNIFYPAMYKRRAFSYESEIRLIRTDFDSTLDASPPPSNHRLRLDLETFVQSIVINPYSPGWYEDAIRWLVAKTSDSLAGRVYSSKMKVGPLY